MRSCYARAHRIAVAAHGERSARAAEAAARLGAVSAAHAVTPGGHDDSADDGVDVPQPNDGIMPSARVASSRERPPAAATRAAVGTHAAVARRPGARESPTGGGGGSDDSECGGCGSDSGDGASGDGEDSAAASPRSTAGFHGRREQRDDAAAQRCEAELRVLKRQLRALVQAHGPDHPKVRLCAVRTVGYST